MSDVGQSYDRDYFIRKFEAIPEENWCCGSLYVEPHYSFDGNWRSCALGHCGVRSYTPEELTPEVKALAQLLDPVNAMNRDDLGSYDVVYDINDGTGTADKGISPKQRILNKLKERM